MKICEGRTHYDILGIPFDADWSTIKRAYHQALDIYAEDALATYALFTDEQRAAMLKAIEEAYHTLIDPHQRAIYNQVLLAAGRVDPSQWPRTEEETSAAEAKRDLNALVKDKAREQEIQCLTAEVLDRDRVSGADLKRLREAFGITLAEIFETTRISKSTLEMIEADRFDQLPAEVFLKAFLKSYARILQIDPQRVVDGYLRRIASDPPEQ